MTNKHNDAEWVANIWRPNHERNKREEARNEGVSISDGVDSANDSVGSGGIDRTDGQRRFHIGGFGGCRIPSR